MNDRRTWKRAVALTLALLVLEPRFTGNIGGVINTISVSAEDISGSCGKTTNDYVNWSYSGGTLTISGTGNMADYNNRGNKNTPPWSDYENSITLVVIVGDVTNVNSSAFNGCRNLSTIIYKNGTTISSNNNGPVQQNLNGVTKVTYTVSDNEITIASITFGNNNPPSSTNKTSVEIPTTIDNKTVTIGDSVLSSLDNNTTVIYNDVTYTKTSNGLEITSINDGAEIPSTLGGLNVTIGSGILDKLSNDAKITYNGITYTIVNDNNTKTLTLTDGTKASGAVEIPSSIGGLSVTAIGANAFNGCTSLASLSIPCKFRSELSTIGIDTKTTTNIDYTNQNYVYTANTGGTAIEYKCSVCGDVQGTATIKALDSPFYTGKAIEATVTYDDKWGEKLKPTITYTAKSGSSLTSNKAIDVGNYTAKITIEGVSASVDFEISKAPPNVTAPSGLTATYGYTLASVTLTNPSGNIAGTWSWDNTSTSVGNVGTNTFSAIFTPSDAKNYTTVTKNVEITVQKANLTVTQPGSSYTINCKEAISNITLPSDTGYSWSFEDSTTTIAVGGNAILKAVCTLTDSANYNAVNSVNVTVNRSAHDYSTYTLNDTENIITNSCSVCGGIKGTATIKAPDSLFYTGKAIEATATSGFTITYKKGDTKLETKPTTVGTYTASIEYGSQTASVTYTITAKTVTPSVTLDQETYYYTGKEIKPSVTVKDGETTISDSEYDVTYSNNTNAGTGTITIKSKADGNYSFTVNKEFTITCKTLLTSMYSINNETYTDKWHNNDVTITANSGYTLYSSDNYNDTNAVSYSNDTSSTSLYLYLVEDATGARISQSADTFTTPSILVKIDKTAPTVTVTPNTGNSTDYDNSVTFTISAEDETSDVASITYTLDGTATTISSSEPTIKVDTKGSHTLSVTATDNAGNKSTEVKRTFAVWKTPDISITSSESIVYDGSVIEEGTDKDFTLDKGESDGNVTYYYKGADDTTENYTEGLPTNAGSYSIKAVIAEDKNSHYHTATVTQNITIAQAKRSTIKVSMSGYTYGSTPNSPSISNKDESLTVKYYYNTTDSNSDGTEWNSPSLDAGTYYMYAVIDGGNNYEEYTTDPVEFKVSQAKLTVTANSQSIIYGDAVPQYTVTYSGFVNGENENALSNELALTCNYTQSSNVGTYTITPSGLTSENYEIEFVNGTLTVNQKEIGLEWNNVNSRVYGDGLEVTATATGTVNDDKIGVTVKNGDQTNAGTYTATATALTGDKAKNYVLPKEVTKEYTIGKKALTITANRKIITYGDDAPSYSVSYSGFENGETSSNLGGKLVLSCTYTKYGNVGNYTITPSGLTSDNYDITFKVGTLTVNQKEIDLTWNNVDSRVYGDGKTVTATATGTVNGDEIGVTVTGGAETNAGTYTATATALTGDKAKNYVLPKDVEKEYTVALADLDVTVPETYTLNCTQTLDDITLPSGDGYHWTFEETALTIGENTLTAVCIVDDTANHNAVESVEVTVTLSHVWSETYTVDKSATCTEKGSKSVHCTLCDETKNVTEIPATGHSYGEPKFEWDGTDCIATFICENDSTHIQTVDCEISTEENDEATTYTATATFDDKSYTIEIAKPVTIAEVITDVTTTVEETTTTEATTTTTEATTDVTTTIEETITTPETTTQTETTTTTTEVTTTTTEATTTIAEPVEIIPTGDISGNDEVNVFDLLLLKKYLLGMLKVDKNSSTYKAMDINHDGLVKSDDLLMFKKFILGMIDSID